MSLGHKDDKFLQGADAIKHYEDLVVAELKNKFKKRKDLNNDNYSDTIVSLQTLNKFREHDIFSESAEGILVYIYHNYDWKQIVPLRFFTCCT